MLKFPIALICTAVLVTVVFVSTNSSHAFSTDNFNSATNWVGENGWETAGFGGYVRNNGAISATGGFGGSQGVGASPAGTGGNVTFGHGARDITGDLTGGSFLWQVDVNAPAVGPAGGFAMNVGALATVVHPGGTPDASSGGITSLEFAAVSQGSATRWEWGAQSGGSLIPGSNGDSSFDIGDLGWFQMKLEGDATGATAEYRDIDDASGAPIGTWIAINTYSDAEVDFDPTGGTGASLRIIGTAIGDNAISGVPEPSSLVLAMLGIMALLASRRTRS